MYLLDTNVVSELRRPRPHGAVLTWLSGVPDEQVFLSAVTVGELQAGAEITRDQDAVKAQEIDRWIDRIANAYIILALDAHIMRAWARLMHRSSDVLSLDAMIAATALVHRLTVATRNTRDFKAFGVPTFDPFAAKS